MTSYGISRFARIALFALSSLLSFVALPASSQQIWKAAVPANYLVYDPINKKIYACVGNKENSGLSNSVVRIDPATGKVEKSVFVGSDPSVLALSDKSKYLYVRLNDGHTIRRIDLDTMTPGMQFPSGDGVAVSGIMTMPGVPEGVVAMQYRRGVSPAGERLVLFVNGKEQPLKAGSGNCLSYGIHPTRIFTYQNSISSWDFTAHHATPDGVMNVGSTGTLLSGFVNLSGHINGLLITSTGGIIDPEARQSIGSLPDAGRDITICSDPERALVFQLLGEGDDTKLRAYDIRTMAKAGEVSLKGTGVNGGAHLLRWGERGVAFVSGDAIYFVQLTLTPKLTPVDLSVQRSTLPAPLPRQQQIKYTLTVANNSSSKATGVFLTEALPGGVEVTEMKASQGDVVLVGGIIRAELGDLAARAKATVTVTLQTSSPGGVGFTAVARGQDPDPTTQNNIALFSLSGPNANAADLIGEWAGLEQTSVGAGINLRAALLGRLVVKNQGKQASRPCVVRFYITPSPGLIVARSQLLQEVFLPALRAKETYNVSLQAPLGQGDDVTGWFVFGVIDANNVMDESDKGNNVLRARVP